MPVRRSASAIRASASATARSAAAIAAALAPWQPSHGCLVPMAQAAASAALAVSRSRRPCPRSCCARSRARAACSRKSSTSRRRSRSRSSASDSASRNSPSEPYPEPSCRSFRLPAAYPVAGVQGLQGGGQADHRLRVDARALRAREDPGDALGEFPGLVQHLRARVQLLLFTAHDPGLPSRSDTCGGDGCATWQKRPETSTGGSLGRQPDVCWMISRTISGRFLDVLSVTVRHSRRPGGGSGAAG